MKTVKITYPVIRFCTMEVDVTDEQADELENGNQETKAQFMVEQNEKQDLPEMTWQKLIEDAMDVDYTTLKILDKGIFKPV